MALYMLGTDIALRLIRGRTPALDARVAASAVDELCISALTRGELLCGVQQARQGTQDYWEPRSTAAGVPASLRDIEPLRGVTHEFLASLSPETLQKLRRKFGLDPEKTPTLEEVTRHFDLTRELLARARARLQRDRPGGTLRQDRGDDRLSLLLDRFLARLTCLPWDATAATHFASVTSQLETAGIPTHPIDRMIAGHAIAARAVFVTTQAETFMAVTDLRVEDWS